MRRLLIAAWLALAVVGTGLLPPPADATIGLPSRWSTWVVNHTTKTITVTVKMQIYLGPCAPIRGGTAIRRGSDGGGQAPTASDLAAGKVCSTLIADIAKAIKANIDAVWNQGLMYRCYKLKFIVDITFTDDRFSVDPDRVGARIDRSMQNARSHVLGRGPSDDRWQSNEVADRIDPDNVVLDPTEFGYPPLSENTYAHEFGHVLGLDDQYDEDTQLPRPGAPNDLMSDMGSNIDQSTVDRVVERNRDRLVDTSGKSVKLDDLRCPTFRASLEITQDEYNASNIFNATAIRPCTPGPFSSSTKQLIDVTSKEVDVFVREDASVTPLGYLLLPQLDTLTIRSGIRFGVRAGDAAGLFDLPIDVKVSRSHAAPASGPKPDPISVNGGCPGGTPNGGNNRLDCGIRYYRAWMAMSQEGDKLWPIASKLPALLNLTGFSMERLSKLYTTCPGPNPWPTDFAIDPASVRTPGPLPPLAKLKQVSDDWRLRGRDGKIEIDGTATLDIIEQGRLVQDDLFWTLTLCPVDKDGKTPNNCP